MNGIPLESGINDCCWNIDGKCTSWKCTQAIPISDQTRYWGSKQNYTLTQIGVTMCSEYFQEGKLR
jgi:hypothetical protein